MADNQNDDAPDIDLNDPRIKAVIEQQVGEQTKGLQAKNKELLGKVKEATSTHQALLEQLGGEEGIKSLTTLRERFEQDEYAKLLKDGKLDDLKTAIADKTRASFKGELDKLTKTLEAEKSGKAEAEKQAHNYRDRFSRYLLRDHVRGLATKLSLRDEAHDDAVLLAERHIRVDPDTGKFTVVDESGEDLIGTDGKAVTPEAWLNATTEKRPHWLKPSAGGGAGGGGGRPGTKKRSEMTRAEKAEFITKHGEEAYRKLPY